MTDEEIVRQLSLEGSKKTPVEVAELLNVLSGGKLSQGAIVTYFKRAFPEIPLRTLLQAGGWHRLSSGGLTDNEFNEMLRPWIGPSHDSTRDH